MKLIEQTLKYETIYEIRREGTKIIYMKYIVITCLVGIVGPLVCLHDAIKTFYSDVYEKNYIFILTVYILVRLLKFAMDVFIFMNLFRILRIFLQIKFALMKRKEEKTTLPLLLVIIAIYFVILLNVFHAIMWQLSFFVPLFMSD